MKTRLNLTIDSTLLQQIKSYAAKNNRSISALVEDYFSQITVKDVKKKSIFDFMKEMKQGSYPKNFDFKSAYFKEQEEKYGK